MALSKHFHVAHTLYTVVNTQRVFHEMKNEGKKGKKDAFITTSGRDTIHIVYIFNKRL